MVEHLFGSKEHSRVTAKNAPLRCEVVKVKMNI